MRNMNNYDDNNPYLNQDFNANDGFDDFEEPFDATKAYSSSFDNQYNSSQNMYGNGSYTNSYVRYNDATSLNEELRKKNEDLSGSWYSLDGLKLLGKPAQKGIYIHNGKKQFVK